MKKYHLSPGYFLSVATLEPRKNLQGLIKAYLKGKFSQNLILAGSEGWQNSEISKLVKTNNKIKLLSGFKHSLCFENITDVEGYVSEKIFDCFKAKCIPIYWGASNIENYIPKDCFIDFREFKEYKKLLDFINSIDEVKYNEYIKNIEKLLKDKKFLKPWFEDGFANFFLEDVLEIKT